MQLYLNSTQAEVNFVSDDPAWSQALGYVKFIELDPFCHTLRLALFNSYDWKFKPRKSAKFNYTLDGKKHTLTIFPKILLSSVTTSPPDTCTPPWTTFTLYARQKR